MMTYRSSADQKRISLLGLGAMRIPVKPGTSEYDQAEFNAFVKRLLDGGVTYYDTSPAYCRGQSERMLGEAFAASGYDRESYAVATKLSNFAPAQFPLVECKKMFASSLKNLRTSYLDFYLLHSIGGGGMPRFRERFVDNGAVDFCAERRAAGEIRHLGFSFHGDRKTFDWCMENHDKYKWDFCQIQLSYLDWWHGEAKELYDALAAKNIPVVVMAPLAGGRLARYNWTLERALKPIDPKASLAEWAFRFVGGLEKVITVLSGMGEMEHIEEDLKIFSPLKPLDAKEVEALRLAADAMRRQNTIACNSCNYCMPCPYGLDIPAILNFRNRMISAETKPSAREVLKLYAEAVPEELRRAEHCTGCNRCSPHCPQKLDIPAEIAAIDQWVEGLKNEAL